MKSFFEQNLGIISRSASVILILSSLNLGQAIMALVSDTRIQGECVFQQIACDTDSGEI